MSGYGAGIRSDALESANARAERAEAMLRELEHERVTKEVHDREARAEAMEVIRLREKQEARTAEIESTRRGSWLRYLTQPERIMPFAEAQFDPSYITNRTPQSGWPPDDVPENHAYLHAPLLASEEFQDGSEPALVKEARARGIPV